MALAQKLGDEVELNPKLNADLQPAFHPLESAFAKIWLTPEEDEAWKYLENDGLLPND
jgi:hypothetical protein